MLRAIIKVSIFVVLFHYILLGMLFSLHIENVPLDAYQADETALDLYASRDEYIERRDLMRAKHPDTAWANLEDPVPAIIGLEHPSVTGIWKWTYNPDKSVYLDTCPAATEHTNSDKSQWTWQGLIQDMKAKKMLVCDISGDGLLDVIIHFDDNVLGYYSFATGTWDLIIDECFDFTVARTASDIPQKVVFSIAQGVYVRDHGEGLTRLYTVPAEIIHSTDLYRDGIDELLNGFSALPNLYVYSFATSSHTLIARVKPSQMVTGDLTCDGHDELVCVFQGLGIYLFRNLGEKGQMTHIDYDDTAIFDIIIDVPQNHKWVSGSKGWQVQRITYIEPMAGHSIALGNIAFGNSKELLFAFNNRTYYYSYSNGFHTLVFAPMKTIIAGRFTGQSKDDLIACMSQTNNVFLRPSSSGAWQLLVNAGNANVMVAYSTKDTYHYEGPAPLPRTGQTISYRKGDDGHYQMGVPWPSPRFTDHGNGTVTDNLTGLMWTKSANMAGTKNWDDTIDWCNDLVHGGHSDWRLPNVRELFSLVDISERNPALPPGHPFTNVIFHHLHCYWSSTTYAGHTGSAWRLSVGTIGNIGYEIKSISHYVWAVRCTSDGEIQVHRTGQTISYRKGDDGHYQMGVPWPTPRFTDHGNGTVTDELTGIMWTRNANMALKFPNVDYPTTDGKLNWNNSIEYCNALYHGGHGDWRLPNVGELQSIIDFSKHDPVMPDGHPFAGVVSSFYSSYWSSTTYAGNTFGAWNVSMGNCIIDANAKTNGYYVWPVRAGN